MKRILITLLAAVVATGAFAQSSFPDVPDNHWAGDAVERLAELGVIIGFPDGTYRGNEAFTRYQAALVASRLIDVFNANMDAALALTRADLESLRNAVQEVASDVAAQGVRLSAAESAIAGLSDDVTGNSARLDALEAAVASGSGGVDPAVLRDLQNQIASQRVAIDTAQAQADAAAARADDAYNLANQANVTGRQNASDIAAINRVLQLMSSDIAALQAAGGGTVTGTVDLSGVQSDIDRNRSDIANLREFAILLRREQVGMRDQVAALEAASAAQQGQIDDLAARVAELESNPLGISGTISITYFVGRIVGDPFDVDRAYGLNNDRDMGASVFSSGAVDLDGDATTSSGYRTEVGEVAQDRHDIEQTSGAATASLSLSLSQAFGFNGAGSPRALNSFSAVVRIDMHTQTIAGPLGSGGAPFNMFHVHSFTTTFSPIGAAPLTFTFGTNVKANFTPYIVNTDHNGFIASLTAPPFLAFLDPALTVVYTTPAADSYLRGARLTMAPLEGVVIGASFAQRADNAEDYQDVDVDNFTRTVYGVDGSVSLSIFDLGFAWAQGSDGTNSDSILYATLGVDGENLPILNELAVNYRAMGDQWDALGFNLGATSASARPFAVDQTGFGARVGLGVSIIDVTGYFDSYSIAAGDSAQAFGVDVDVALFRAISLSGWYHQASVNGAAVDSLSAAGVNRASTHRPANDTSFGVELDHDGSAANALISGLNINAGYMQDTADFSRTTIWADADMELSVSILTLTPYVGFRSVNDSDAGTDDRTTIKVGTGLVTTPLNVYTQPSLMAAVNYRTTSHADLAVYTATELQWSVGLVLNEFIFENSSLTAKYGSWTGTNVSTSTASDATDFATDISAGDVNNGATQSTSGWEIIWDYWDLVFAYGIYQNNNAGVTSSAQAFSISYEVDF